GPPSPCRRAPGWSKSPSLLGLLVHADASVKANFGNGVFPNRSRAAIVQLPMARKCAVRLLGGFQVVVNGQPVPAQEWRHRRGADLVKLLALAPQHRLH